MVRQNYRILSCHGNKQRPTSKDLIIYHLKDNGSDDALSLRNDHARATVLSDTTPQARAYNQLRYHQIFHMMMGNSVTLREVHWTD